MKVKSQIQGNVAGGRHAFCHAHAKSHLLRHSPTQRMQSLSDFNLEVKYQSPLGVVQEILKVVCTPCLIRSDLASEEKKWEDLGLLDDDRD
jgi:hypothetical protein